MDSNGAADMRPMTRIDPLMPASSYKSYKITAPVSTHWRDGTCEEAGCEQYQQGFELVIDESSPLGAFQADYVRGDRSRRCTEERRPDGMTVFTYAPGQKCFTPHKVRLEREENFLITGGDWRGNPRGTPAQALRSDQWVDDFATHQDQLATRLAQG